MLSRMTFDNTGNLYAFGTSTEKNSSEWSIYTLVKYFQNPDAVQELSQNIPTKFSLSQNFPNPFNPKTVIRYSLSSNSEVALKVYDILGREISTLVNENKQAGNYITEWNGEQFPSGIYFYKLQAGNFSETRKFVLLK